ncbi:TrkH family potassium uptake protein [Allofustis seminis]|uniref:TrkH family potassium uptake protein n=1 Tax=Allofustis seminis TaxID=166939 RepID=UPI00036ED5DF|nr:TrkH family potassium uptake protein [Allofustis seminis]
MTLNQLWNDGSAYGKLMIVIGVLVMTPLVILPFYPTDMMYIADFLIPGGVSVLLGLIISARFQMKELTAWKEQLRFNSQVVTFAWLFGILVGALPFVLAGQLPFLRAIFEATSGWTTTGLSTMDVTKTPQIFLFHRSFMQYAGGLGFVMMVIVLLRGKHSMSLYDAEGHPDRLRPNIKSTVQTIILMYSVLLIVGTGLYMMVGMPLFDSLNHAMCALSTGGFSTKLLSIGEYNSVSIEMVTALLMLIGTTNFGVLLLMAQRQWKRAWRVSEMRFLVVLTIVLVGIAALSLVQGTDMGIVESIRQAFFNTVSAFSTSGFATVDYTTWPSVTFAVIVIAMIIGGGIGSTAGGLKLTRAYLIIRIAWMNIKKRFLPKNQVQVETYYKVQGKQVIDADVVSDTFGYFGLYLLVYLVGSTIIALDSNVNLSHAFFEFASSLSTVGLSAGVTNPNSPTITLIVEIVGMILGRLEIYVLLLGVHLTVQQLKRKMFRRNDSSFASIKN